MSTAARKIQLDQLKVATPCTESWDSMTGDDRSRFCDGCGLHVHNLSAMTRDEAQQLVCNAAGRLCIAYVPSAQGTVTTLEYHRQAQPKYRWRWVAALAAVGAVSSGVVAAIVRPWAGQPQQRVIPGALTLGDFMTSPAPANPPLILGQPLPPTTTPSTPRQNAPASTDCFPTDAPGEAINCMSD